MRVAVRVGLLLLLWLLAWGEASVGNIVSGVLLALALLVAFPARHPTRAGPTVSPLGALRLALYVLGQLVPSNVLVAREVVARHSRIRAGVLAYPLRHQSDELLSLVSNVIALTPGTMTVEATREPATLYVHFLLLSDIERARRTVARLEELAVAALGGPDALAPARPSR